MHDKPMHIFCYSIQDKKSCLGGFSETFVSTESSFFFCNMLLETWDGRSRLKIFFVLLVSSKSSCCPQMATKKSENLYKITRRVIFYYYLMNEHCVLIFKEISIFCLVTLFITISNNQGEIFN